MYITEHFTLQEMTASQVATRLGLDNAPGPAELSNLLRTCAMLEQVRTLVGKSVIVSSGYRSKQVNAAVGSGPTSAHVKGLAADITVKGITAKALAMLIRESDIEFDQCIYEGSWVHVGLIEGVQRRQVLTAQFFQVGVKYVQGIV